ncbi:DUF998 domain-containing protein [Corynebacterium hansenii]|uniref:DUF998 domain-containing protein n=1 Tax=Corynebacterium hansenii TaxID=394964 RepID=A0ABV7ZNM3_9CORY|nr:DUF998 domain-containing protein [Corynebacterium hansenii]WJZ00740.1 hypothetical protein CHAN_10700 [Corynebacterium hansenii]
MSTVFVAAAAVILLVLRTGAFIHLHVVRRDLSPLRNTVSDLGTGGSRKEFTVMGILGAIAYALMFVAFLIQGVGPRVPLVALGIGIAALLAMLAFPTDVTGEQRTKTGRMHWILAVVQFAGFFVAMVNFDLTGIVSADMESAMRWVIRVSFYAFLATLVLPPLRERVIGATERVFLTATPLWFIVVGAALALG